jgi:hypothetical protein
VALGALGAPVAVLLLIALMLYEKNIFHTATEEAQEYHREVQEAAEIIPDVIGDWVVTEETEASTAARRLLRPNAIKNKRYKNVVTGEEVTLLFVHCLVATDILNHFPPNCYPTHGWKLEEVRGGAWPVEGREIPGTVYTLSFDRFPTAARIVIYNFMILPDGRMVPDMHEVNRLAQSYRKKYFGAAQIQMVFGERFSESKRDDVFTKFMDAMGGLFDIVMAGVDR